MNAKLSNPDRFHTRSVSHLLLHTPFSFIYLNIIMIIIMFCNQLSMLFFQLKNSHCILILFFFLIICRFDCHLEEEKDDWRWRLGIHCQLSWHFHFCFGCSISFGHSWPQIWSQQLDTNWFCWIQFCWWICLVGW